MNATLGPPPASSHRSVQHGRTPLSQDVDNRLAIQLQQALHDVARRCDRFFTGTSVVICRTLHGLPYHPMNEGCSVDPDASLVDNLLSLAHCDSPYHDGFHLLAPDFEFVKVACYLAPRIPDEPQHVSFAGRGSRFSTAYFMSLLPQVICAGIVRNQRQVTVFQQGAMLEPCPQRVAVAPAQAGSSTAALIGRSVPQAGVRAIPRSG